MTRTQTAIDFLSLFIISLPFTVLAQSGFASDFRAILVDAEIDDWSGATAVHIDPSGDHGGTAIDLQSIFIANDDEFVYFRFEVGNEVGLQTLNSPLRLHIDSDNNTSTGWSVHGIGSDILVEFSSGGSGIEVYEQTSTGFTALDIGFGSFDAYQGPTVADYVFEYRLRRSTVLPLHGTTAFPTSSFRAVFDARNGGSSADLAPDASGGILYNLASGTPPALPDNDLSRLDPLDVRILSYNVHNTAIFGSESIRFTRILQAINPDVIAFQEMADATTGQVEARLDADLPLGGGASWQAFKGDRNQITASRYPITIDSGAPSNELAVLIDLPDADYDLDLYHINSHLKCCGSPGSWQDQQRQESADALISWYRDLQTPGGAELPEGTPILHMGDMNLVGGPQPLLTLLTGDIIDEGTYGSDHAPDWDGTDNSAALPIHTDGLAAYTWRNNFSSFGPGKLDFILMTDSVLELGNRFVLNTADMSTTKLNTHSLLVDDTEEASDHLPLVQDLRPAGTVVAVEESFSGNTGLSLLATPNPFASSTHLDFTLPEEGHVRLLIYDTSGRMVRSLENRSLAAGPHRAAWDGRSKEGTILSPGIYLVRLETRLSDGTTRNSHRKLVLTR